MEWVHRSEDLLNTVRLDGVGTGNESRVDEFFSNDKN
jgi:hypothetical protein